MSVSKFNRQQLYLDILIYVYKTIQQTNSITVHTQMVNCVIGSILRQFCMGTW